MSASNMIFERKSCVVLLSDTLASDRSYRSQLTPIRLSSLSVLLWSKATISASDRAPHAAMSACQPTLASVVKRQILFLEELPKGMVRS
ncbi:hypothetical protein TNCV_1405331 [Trichonephila clavipes]|nr:hypothetical protein TNCV_1405331 [Trichonephila clavipes]